MKYMLHLSFHMLLNIAIILENTKNIMEQFFENRHIKLYTAIAMSFFIHLLVFFIVTLYNKLCKT